MAQARTPVAVIYACGLLTAGLLLFLMIYSGMFDGAWDALLDLLRELTKYFWG
jgi:hypothetical protein